MSTKDELILDIVEKIHDKQELIVKDVQEMKIEQVRQNLIVTQHEQRSTASEGRLALLEKDAQFFRNFIMIMTALGGITGLVVKVLPLLHR